MLLQEIKHWIPDYYKTMILEIFLLLAVIYFFMKTKLNTHFTKHNFF